MIGLVAVYDQFVISPYTMQDHRFIQLFCERQLPFKSIFLNFPGDVNGFIKADLPDRQHLGIISLPFNPVEILFYRSGIHIPGMYSRGKETRMNELIVLARGDVQKHCGIIVRIIGMRMYVDVMIHTPRVFNNAIPFSIRAVVSSLPSRAIISVRCGPKAPPTSKTRKGFIIFPIPVWFFSL